LTKTYKLKYQWDQVQDSPVKSTARGRDDPPLRVVTAVNGLTVEGGAGREGIIFRIDTFDPVGLSRSVLDSDLPL
jgi:hypothetical protein